MGGKKYASHDTLLLSCCRVGRRAVVRGPRLGAFGGQIGVCGVLYSSHVLRAGFPCQKVEYVRIRANTCVTSRFSLFFFFFCLRANTCVTSRFFFIFFLFFFQSLAFFKLSSPNYYFFVENNIFLLASTQVSFATVVLGLSRRGDAPAGRKAISLYDHMRRDFGFVPDEVRVLKTQRFHTWTNNVKICVILFVGYYITRSACVNGSEHV